MPRASHLVLWYLITGIVRSQAFIIICVLCLNEFSNKISPFHLLYCLQAKPKLLAPAYKAPRGQPPTDLCSSPLSPGLCTTCALCLLFQAKSMPARCS